MGETATRANGRAQQAEQRKAKQESRGGGLYRKSKKNGQLQDSGAVPGKGLDLHIHGVRSERIGGCRRQSDRHQTAMDNNGGKK